MIGSDLEADALGPIKGSEIKNRGCATSSKFRAKGYLFSNSIVLCIFSMHRKQISCLKCPLARKLSVNGHGPLWLLTSLGDSDLLMPKNDILAEKAGYSSP